MKKNIYLISFSLLFLSFTTGSFGPEGCDYPSISGMLKDTEGTPIAGATVTATAQDPITEVPIEPVTTDSNGAYQFSNLPAGTYLVVITTGDYSSSTTVTVAQMTGGLSGCSPQTADFTITSLDFDESLVSYWEVDQSTAIPATLVDSKGNNNGTFGAGAAAPAWNSGGKEGDCLYFDGGDYVDIGTFNAFTGDSDISVALWIKFNKDDLNNTVQLIDCNYATDNRYKGFQLYLNYLSGVISVRFGCHQSDVFGYVSSAALNKNVGDNNWHFIVGVRDHSGLSKFKLYIDGDEAQGNATTAGDIVDSAGNAYYSIGAHYSHSQGYFKGYLDKIRIFKKALSSNEVQALYTE